MIKVAVKYTETDALLESIKKMSPGKKAVSMGSLGLVGGPLLALSGLGYAVSGIPAAAGVVANKAKLNRLGGALAGSAKLLQKVPTAVGAASALAGYLAYKHKKKDKETSD